MTDNFDKVQLTNFDNVDSTNQLLRHVGVEHDLGAFLVEHLGEVLRKQHPDTSIFSVELVDVQKCTIGGEQNPDGSIVEVDSICIPMEINAGVTVSSERQVLNLQVDIYAKAVGAGFNIESNVVVNKQSII